MTAYRVLYASVIRNSGLLKVIAEEKSPENSLDFRVEGEPDKTLKFRTARPTYNTDGSRAPEKIFVVERSDFDLTALIGKRIRDD